MASIAFDSLLNSIYLNVLINLMFHAVVSPNVGIHQIVALLGGFIAQRARSRLCASSSPYVTSLFAASLLISHSQLSSFWLRLHSPPRLSSLFLYSLAHTDTHNVHRNPPWESSVMLRRLGVPGWLTIDMKLRYHTWYVGRRESVR